MVRLGGTRIAATALSLMALAFGTGLTTHTSAAASVASVASVGSVASVAAVSSVSSVSSASSASAPPAPVPSSHLRASNFGHVGSTASSPPFGRSVHGSAFAGAGVLAYGKAAFYGSPTNLSLNSPVVGMAVTPTSNGYWLVAADGGIFNYGDATFKGSAGGIDLYAPIVGMAALGTGTGRSGTTGPGTGYWLTAIDGGIFAFGNAGFYGSMGGHPLASPVVGMAATATGKGYWEVAADGGLFAFGDAGFYGSMGGHPLASPVVGMAITPTGKGYWEVAADGGIFTFGDAVYYGSTGGKPLNASIAGMATSAKGLGYWLAGSDGAIYPFGNAVNYGSNAATVPTPPIVAIAANKDATGYWMLDPDAFPTALTHPALPSPIASAGTIVQVATSKVGGNTDSAQGPFCNPYGPCEPWCSLFATWVWQQAGIPIPRYPFTGDMYTWASQHGVVQPPSSWPVRGQAVLYGTGPSTVGTSVHVGIVAQVWPDGAIVTVEGDAGPGPYGRFNTIINGPFLPSQSQAFNGYPIYAFAQP